MADLVETLLQGVDKITLETNATPMLTLDHPFAPGPPNPLVKALQPKITLYIGGKAIPIAPYGSPDSDFWPVVLAVAVIGALGVAWVGCRMFKAS